MSKSQIEIDNSENYLKKYGWYYDDKDYMFKAPPGLNHDVIEQISKIKGEPEWMREFRHQSLDLFLTMEVPHWASVIHDIDFQDIHYYLQRANKVWSDWSEVPEDVRETYTKLGIPEAEQKHLAGVGAQYDSEVIYHKVREELTKQGVIFLSCDEGLRQHPDLFREHWASVVPPNDNKLAALNSAVWSGGSFIYVPKGVKVEIPLEAYFRINADKAGQFERTLIIADENSFVHYIEGCTAPVYSNHSLHSAVVEIVVKANARVRYSTVQNWSTNVNNLVTKRTKVYRNGVMEWIDGNIGSRLTMKYPACVLMEPGAHGEVVSVAYAGENQHQDAGAKMIHLAPNTSSRIISKSISKGNGRSSFRGLVKVVKGATNVKSTVQCDALLLNPESRSDTYPIIEVKEKSVTIAHEARVSKVSDDQLLYLMSRGIPEDEAKAMVVSGFIEPVSRELPLEFAVELNRLIQLELEGSVG